MAGYIQNCSTRGRLAIAAEDLTLGSSGADRDPAGRTPTRSIANSTPCRFLITFLTLIAGTGEDSVFGYGFCRASWRW
jgi:hypothetical protein